MIPTQTIMAILYFNINMLIYNIPSAVTFSLSAREIMQTLYDILSILTHLSLKQRYTETFSSQYGIDTYTSLYLIDFDSLIIKARPRTDPSHLMLRYYSYLKYWSLNENDKGVIRLRCEDGQKEALVWRDCCCDAWQYQHVHRMPC